MPVKSELLPITLLLLTFLISGWLTMWKYPLAKVDEQKRDIQLDGLRAMLALGVMVWHYFIIRDVIHIDEHLWGFAKISTISSLTGGWTVQMFFAITAYLFSYRFVDPDSNNVEWLRFYVGRLFRLVPVCLLCALFVIVLKNEEFFGNSDPIRIKANWLALLDVGTSSIRKAVGVIGSPESDAWKTSVPIGAHWSLRYEWYFYALLPTIGLMFRRSRNLTWSVVSLAILALSLRTDKFFFNNWSTITWSFIPGLLLGFTMRYWRKFRHLRHWGFGLLAITLVILSAFANTLKVKILANTLFLAVVLSRNSFTSVLESKLLRSLGETTYSIYLLHGLVQYATLKWIITIPVAQSMPEWLWWVTCAIQVALIVIIARISFECVEKPGIDAGNYFHKSLMNFVEQRANWLRNWI